MRGYDTIVDKAPRLSISIVIWILSSDTDTDTICQLNQSHTNSEAAMLSSPLPPDIFCKDQNLHQVVHLTYTIWGANEPNGREYENCIETRLKSFSNGTQKYPKQIQKSTQNKLQKHPVYICTIKLPQIYFFRFWLKVCALERRHLREEWKKIFLRVFRSPGFSSQRPLRLPGVISYFF